MVLGRFSQLDLRQLLVDVVGMRSVGSWLNIYADHTLGLVPGGLHHVTEDVLAHLKNALSDRYAIESELGRGGWPRFILLEI